MLKEIATKTKNGPYYKCTACLPAEALTKEGGDEIFWNTHKELIECKCKKMWVDGCEDYVRIGGTEKDYEVIYK